MGRWRRREDPRSTGRARPVRCAPSTRTAGEERLRYLQRTAGNRAVAAALGQNRPWKFYFTIFDPGTDSTFPNPIAETNWTHKPDAPALTKVTVGDRTKFVMDGVASTYDTALNFSRVPSTGWKNLGTVTRGQDGVWDSSTLRRYLLSDDFVPGNLPGRVGSYEFRVVVSSEDAVAIKAFEQEHLDDFALAWQLTLGQASTLVQSAPTAVKAPMSALVNHLIGSGAACLIPRDPDDLAAWGQHLKTQFALLATESKTRDTTGQHTPVGYRFRGFASGPPRLEMRFRFGPARASTAYISANKLPIAFGWNSYEARSQAIAAAASLQPGQRVRMPVDAVPNTAYASTDTTSANLSDARALRSTVHDCTFVEQRGNDAWLRIRAPSDFEFIATAWENKQAFVFICVPATVVEPA